MIELKSFIIGLMLGVGIMGTGIILIGIKEYLKTTKIVKDFFKKGKTK